MRNIKVKLTMFRDHVNNWIHWKDINDPYQFPSIYVHFRIGYLCVSWNHYRSLSTSSGSTLYSWTRCDFPHQKVMSAALVLRSLQHYNKICQNRKKKKRILDIPVLGIGLQNWRIKDTLPKFRLSKQHQQWQVPGWRPLGKWKDLLPERLKLELGAQFRSCSTDPKPKKVDINTTINYTTSLKRTPKIHTHHSLSWLGSWWIFSAALLSSPFRSRY